MDVVGNRIFECRTFACTSRLRRVENTATANGLVGRARTHYRRRPSFTIRECTMWQCEKKTNQQINKCEFFHSSMGRLYDAAKTKQTSGHGAVWPLKSLLGTRSGPNRTWISMSFAFLSGGGRAPALQRDCTVANPLQLYVLPNENQDICFAFFWQR